MHRDRATRARPVTRPALHFIGFRGDEFLRAVRIFGYPNFIHRDWDGWARDEIAPGDIAVFARGSDQDPIKRHPFNDSSVL